MITTMKKIWKYITVALAGLSLVACNKESVETSKEENTPSGEYTYIIAVDESSKTFLDGDHIAWESTDWVSWYAASGSYGYPGYSQIIMSDPRTFSVKCPISISVGGHIYACTNSWGVDYSGGTTLFIPEQQYGVINDAMPMVSLPVDVTETIPTNQETPAGKARFINLGAVIQYNVYTSDAEYAEEAVLSVSFAATSPIAGAFPVDLTSVSESSIPSPSGLTENTVTSSLSNPELVGGSKEDGIKVYQVVAPGTLSGTVTVTTDAAIYSFPVSEVELNRAFIKTFNVNLASSNAVRRTPADIEKLLASCEWQLVSVADYSDEDITKNAGDVLTFNADHSIAITCNTQENEVYDYTQGSWIDLGLGFAWGDVTREWSVSSFKGVYPMLDFTTYAYPLAVVDDHNSVPTSFDIVTLTNNSLVLKYSGYYGDYTITFSAVGGPAPEFNVEKLMSHEWVLTSVSKKGKSETEYRDDTHTAGNTITFNSDGSYTVDCSANSDLVYDYVDDCLLSNTHDMFSQSYFLEWSVSSGAVNKLNFTQYAYPLVVVGDFINTALSYEIAALTDTYLELRYEGDDYDFIIKFSSPAEIANVEAQLAGLTWTLSTVTCDGVDVTRTAGNTITLYADHSFSFDCSENSELPGCTYDYTDQSGVYCEPYFGFYGASYEWSVETGVDANSLRFTRYSYPLVIVGDYLDTALSYTIVTLTDSVLEIEYNNSSLGLYRISFTAVTP